MVTHRRMQGTAGAGTGSSQAGRCNLICTDWCGCLPGAVIVQIELETNQRGGNCSNSGMNSDKGNCTNKGEFNHACKDEYVDTKRTRMLNELECKTELHVKRSPILIKSES